MTHGGNVWQGASPADWLDFSANLRPEGPPGWVAEAMRRAVLEARYYPDLSMRAARAGLAAYAGVPEDCLLPTAGGIEAIDAVCRAGAGRVLVAQPTFGEYARRARACGREVVSCPPGAFGTRGAPGTRGALETPGAFAAPGAFGMPGAPRAGDTAFLCNPNNPTGEALERHQVLELAERAFGAGGLLAVDEAFIDCCPECSIRDRAAAEAGLIAVGSLTKALCVPGARLGYLIAPPAVIARLRELIPPWSLNAFAAAIARELPGHLDGLRADCLRNAARREVLALRLSALGARVWPSRANFLLADFGRPMAAAIEALRAERILVRECASFGLGDNFLRFAVRTEAENARLTGALARILG